MDDQTLEKKTVDPADGTVANVKMPLGVTKIPKREYDIIVFGASGFTGKFVVKEMDYFSQIYGVTWAVAGRDSKKLQNVLNDLYKTRDGNEEKKIDIIYADVQDITSVIKMAQAASVIINCTGPYYIYGEVVVKSCVMNSTHYVDVTGESLFMEKMAYLYNNKAEEKHSVIVSALGMESVPADLGVEYLYNHFNGELLNVGVYMKFYSASFFTFTNSAYIHEGTWISTILHLATTKKLSYYRALLDESIGLIRTKPNFTRFLHRQQISAHNDERQWCLAFTEPDQAVITRSIHHAKVVDQLPYNFNVKNYIVFGGLIPAIISFIIFLLLSIMARFEPIRILLVRYPKFFSFGVATKTGPNETIMKNSRLTVTVIGYGSTSAKQHATNLKDGVNCKRRTIVKVHAKNPGYGLASKAVVLGAITILKDHDSIPKGGVLTPAAAFRKSQYVNRLIEHDVALFETDSDLVSYRLHKKFV